MSTPRVGFIGLGSQGAPMARRIVEGGHPLTVWARRPESVAPFADTAAEVAATPARLAAASDIVGICVVADADVEDVLLRDDGVLAGMAPGGIVAIHSTVHPDTCRRLAEVAAGGDVEVIDAPVSGGAPAAEAGRLLVMVGGPKTALERCRPVFATFGEQILHLGDLGRGQAAKALNNLVFAAQVALALDTYAFADGIGIHRDALAEVLANGSGGSRAAAILAAADFDTEGIASAAPLLRKDIDIALDLAEVAGAPPSAAVVDLAERALQMVTS